MQQQQQKSKTKKNNEVKVSERQKLHEEHIYLKKNFSKKQGKCLGSKTYSSSLSKNLRQPVATKTNDLNQQVVFKRGTG